MYIRSEINPCKANLLDLTTVLELAGHLKKLTLIREAATINSISGIQGIPYGVVKQNARHTCVLAGCIQNL